MSLAAVRTVELLGPALDWAVAQIERVPFSALASSKHHFAPSSRWNQGGRLIERHGIEVFCNLSAEQAARFKESQPDWRACMNMGRSQHSHGRTPLVAAMRCLVAAKLGDTVHVPEELL